MKTYKHNLLAHLICLAVSSLFFMVVIKVPTDTHFKGTASARVAFLTGFALCGVGVVTLYLTSVANRYKVTDEGLHVHGVFRSSFYAWHEITRLSWNVPLHTLFAYGQNGMIFYSSTDCFPRLVEFLRIIRERSQCQLSLRLEKALGVPPVRT